MLTDTDAKQNIAANVQSLLEVLGMSQSELAEATGESSARISLMIRGIKCPSAAFLARIAEALGTTADALLKPVSKKPVRKPTQPRAEKIIA